jgi:antitoxin (DNA-binding transcriptional repressor) of toxin-antitoxin stability system
MSQAKRVPIAQARASLKDLVDDVNDSGGRVKLTRYDRTIAGLVSAGDLRLLEECKEEVGEKAPMSDDEQAPPQRRRKRK